MNSWLQWLLRTGSRLMSRTICPRRTASRAATGFPHREIARFTVDTFLHSYSQILFCESRRVGVILVLATAVSPKLMLGGAAAVALASLFVLLFRLNRDMLRCGLYGYNALLVGLGTASLTKPVPLSLALAAITVLFTVLLISAIYPLLAGRTGLPMLTLPFLVAFYLFLGAAHVVSVDRVHPIVAQPFAGWIPWQPLALYLRSLGAIFFLPRIDAGLLLLVSLLVYSRMAVVLSVIGFALSLIVLTRVDTVWNGFLPIVTGYNFILVAIAIGTVWFRPSLPSTVMSMVALLVSALTTLGLLPIMVRIGLPLLILPFNLTVLFMIYTIRRSLGGAAGMPRDAAKTKLSTYSSATTVATERQIGDQAPVTAGSMAGDSSHRPSVSTDYASGTDSKSDQS